MGNFSGFAALRLVVSGLACRRGEAVLFSGLGFEVGPGSLLVLRGANGAGKTTLLHTIAGLVRPEAGRMVFDGLDAEQRSGTALHLVGHQTGIKPRLTLTENLEFWAALNGPGLGTGAALEAVGLADLGWLDAGHLSAGQSRRLALARLLVSRRPLWLLDEPTATLDSAGEALVGKLLNAHLRQGGLAIAATHQALVLEAPLVATTLWLGERP